MMPLVLILPVMPLCVVLMKEFKAMHVCHVLLDTVMTLETMPLVQIHFVMPIHV
jgi:hypothetical protein